MKKRCLTAVVLSILAVGIARAADTGQDILEATGVRGGVVLHVGCGDGTLTRQLRPDERYLVQGLDTDAENVAKARRQLHDAGVYGNISVIRFDGENLPYVDNFANLIVVTSDDPPAPSEIMRVLAPRGVAYVKEGPERRHLHGRHRQCLAAIRRHRQRRAVDGLRRVPGTPGRSDRLQPPTPETRRIRNSGRTPSIPASATTRARRKRPMSATA